MLLGILKSLLSGDDKFDNIGSNRIAEEMITEDRWDSRDNLPDCTVETSDGSVYTGRGEYIVTEDCFNIYEAGIPNHAVPTHIHIPVQTDSAADNFIERSELKSFIRVPVGRHSKVVNGPTYNSRSMFPYLRVELLGLNRTLVESGYE